MYSSRCSFIGNSKNHLNFCEQGRPLQITLSAHGSCRIDRASARGFGTGYTPQHPSGSSGSDPLHLLAPTLVSLKFNFCERGGCASCLRYHVRRRGVSSPPIKSIQGESTLSEAVREAMGSNLCLLCRKMGLPRQRR